MEVPETKTRAQRMAEQYGAKLDSSTGRKPAPREIKASDKTELGQKEKLNKAVQKLADFRDLL